jgi:hypothetical protein
MSSKVLNCGYAKESLYCEENVIEIMVAMS